MMKDDNSSSDRGHAENGGSELDGQLQKVTSHLHSKRARLGLQPQAPITEDHELMEHNNLAWAQFKLILKEPLAEMFGTFILVLFGCGAIAQVTLSKANSADGVGYGDWQSINWGFGLGLMLGVYVAGNSGAFLNPAVTLTSCVLRKMPWRRLPVYTIAQILGAFLAAGVVYGNYVNGINAAEGHNVRTNVTAGIFATYPSADLSGAKASQFFEQFIASALLNFVIFALQDDSNKGSFVASGAWFPLCLFFLMFGIGASFGWQTGFAINLARDFGPRLMSYCVGYGNEVWTAGGYYFWIPMVAPYCGCLFGGILYDLFIYTGESPVNQPFFGLGDIIHPMRGLRTRIERQKEENIV